jgi:hypothetical protein
VGGRSHGEESGRATGSRSSSAPIDAGRTRNEALAENCRRSRCPIDSPGVASTYEIGRTARPLWMLPVAVLVAVWTAAAAHHLIEVPANRWIVAQYGGRSSSEFGS